jgi:FkbM family methyltransferase
MSIVRSLRKISADIWGISRIVGLSTTTMWLAAILKNMPEIYRSGNLQVADRALGSGPFQVDYSDEVNFRIAGPGALSGIREMYVRDTYLRGGCLEIDDGDIVVDLGANIGNFTNLALAHGPRVKVIAVEPSHAFLRSMKASLALNDGFAERVSVVQAFLGHVSSMQLDLSDDPSYAGSSWMTEEELLEATSLKCVDFLKCDIEGGEFGLLHRESALLRMTRKLAIEVHAFAGDVQTFIHMLKDVGFTVRHIQRDPDGTATVLARRG